jgi:hypothetical protein
VCEAPATNDYVHAARAALTVCCLPPAASSRATAPWATEGREGTDLAGGELDAEAVVVGHAWSVRAPVSVVGRKAVRLTPVCCGA